MYLWTEDIRSEYLFIDVHSNFLGNLVYIIF